MPARPLALSVATLLCAVVTAAAVHQAVRTASPRRGSCSPGRPNDRGDVPVARAIVALSGALIGGVGMAGALLVLDDGAPIMNLAVPALIVSAGCALVVCAIAGFGRWAGLTDGRAGRVARGVLVGTGVVLLATVLGNMSFEAGSGLPEYRRDADSRCKPGRNVDSEPGPDRGRTRPAPPPMPSAVAGERWSRQLVPSSAPVSVGWGSVLAPLGEEVLALDLGNGDERWRRRMATFSPVVESVAVTPGRVHVLTRGDAVILDSADGRVVGEHEEAGFAADELVAGADAVYSSGPFDVVASDPHTGGHRWTAELSSLLRGPVPGPGVVAVLTGGGEVGATATVVALHYMDGTVRWRMQLPAGAAADPAVGHGQVYVADSDGVLHSFDAATGARRWQFRLRGRHEHSSSPVAGEHSVYVTDQAGIVSAIDPRTGGERWCRGFAGRVSDPVEGGRILYVTEGGDAAGVVHALDATTGSPRGTLRFPVALAGPPRATPGEIVVTLSNGVVTVTGVTVR